MPKPTDALLADQPGQDRLAYLTKMAGAVGEDGLTEDEYAELQAFQDAERGSSPDDHLANLAESMDESDLSRIGQDVIDWVVRDELSRESWMERERKGFLLLGVSESLDSGDGAASFVGQSKVVHPLLAEAVVQFQSRAITELFPAGGPVKTKVLGKITDERQAQAERVEGFLNYQYTTQMPNGFTEEDRLLFRLPLSGSCFKKVYTDPLERTVMAILVEPADMIVPYSASDLRTASRYTHRWYESANVVRRKIKAGDYRKVEVTGGGNEMLQYSDVHADIDEIEGRESTNVNEDQRHTILECHCDLDLPGFEDVDEDGNLTGIELPYIVTVDRDEVQVLAIRRNWRKTDPDKRKRVHFIHKYFLPGLGFYGFGLVHLIGGLSRAATGALRAYLDAAGFANLKGGFRSKDAKIDGGDTPIGMGEWREVRCSTDELKSAFVPLPYDEPSTAMFQVLGLLGELGQRFASTTENMVGDANNNGPVGTTLALIEQGSKIFSAIHKRLHEANAQEFKLVAELDSEYLPQVYPYLVEGEDQYVMAADFDERVDILPVSDPNIISNTQRIAQAQSVLQLAAQAPNLYDMREAHKRMLEALRIPNIDELMPDPADVPRAEPVEENMALLVGKPVKAFPDQQHQAHLMVHQAWWGTVPPDFQQLRQGDFMAHVAEHLAWEYRLAMQAAMGVQLPMPQYLAEGNLPEMPPEIQQQLELMAAAASQSINLPGAQMMQPPPAPAEPDPMAQAARDEDRKDYQAQREAQRKDAMAVADIARKDAITAAQATQAAEEFPGQAVRNREAELMGEPI